MGKSLKDIFADLKARKRVGVFPFIPAGYPDLNATRELLPALERVRGKGYASAYTRRLAH